MNWLDQAIGFISPRTAYMREAWRQQLDSIRSIGYDAADSGRINQNWRVSNEAAELTDRTARDVIRARTRDLERNSDMANGILSAFKRNVVGTGFTLQARTGDDELDSQIEWLWHLWTRKQNCDITRQQNFNQILRMALVRKKVDGGILFKKCYTKGGILPFKLQALEVDELATSVASPHTKGNRVIGGIEYNEYNRPVGYWIEQYNIDGWQINQPVYYPAKDIIFYFTKKRPSQLREISDLSQSVNRIRDANEFISAVSMKERIAACFALLIKRAVPLGGLTPGRNALGKDGKDQHSYSNKMLTPGLVSTLNAGDEAQVIDPKDSSSDATTFLKLLQRLVCSGQGLSYEATARDMSDTTYSSARQSMIEDELTYAEEKEQLQEDFMDEVYETFLISAVLSGALTISDFWDNPQKYMSHSWVSTPKSWIDPQKEANANKIALESGVKTFKQVSAEQGQDWKKQIDDMADVLEYATEKGVKIGGVTIEQSGESASSGKEDDE
ncbi:MAG: phage portal protein [Faecalibacterium sp.]